MNLRAAACGCAAIVVAGTGALLRPAAPGASPAASLCESETTVQIGQAPSGVNAPPEVVRAAVTVPAGVTEAQPLKLEDTATGAIPADPTRPDWMDWRVDYYGRPNATYPGKKTEWLVILGFAPTISTNPGVPTGKTLTWRVTVPYLYDGSCPQAAAAAAGPPPVTVRAGPHGTLLLTIGVFGPIKRYVVAAPPGHAIRLVKLPKSLDCATKGGTATCTGSPAKTAPIDVDISPEIKAAFFSETSTRSSVTVHVDDASSIPPPKSPKSLDQQIAKLYQVKRLLTKLTVQDAKERLALASSILNDLADNAEDGSQYQDALRLDASYAGYAFHASLQSPSIEASDVEAASGLTDDLIKSLESLAGP